MFQTVQQHLAHHHSNSPWQYEDSFVQYKDDPARRHVAVKVFNFNKVYDNDTLELSPDAPAAVVEEEQLAMNYSARKRTRMEFRAHLACHKHPYIVQAREYVKFPEDKSGMVCVHVLLTVSLLQRVRLFSIVYNLYAAL